MNTTLVILIVSFTVPFIMRFLEWYLLKKGKSKKTTTIYTLLFTAITYIFIYFTIHFLFGKYIR